MKYYLDLFSPETYESFSKSARDVSGFRIRHRKAAQKVLPGDKLLCYLTKLSRWFGILEVISECFEDHTPILYPEADPFIIRFKVKPKVWLDKEQAVPIRETEVWKNLSFTRDQDRQSSQWTGKFRSSLNLIEDGDGQFLEHLLLSQQKNGKVYRVDEAKYAMLIGKRIRGPNKPVSVLVPGKADTEIDQAGDKGIRESAHIQALLAKIGETMGFRVWLPRNDRSRVLKEWKPKEQTLLEALPLNYEETTLHTIENIDVLWIRKRSIARAFEVEHSTSIYSGLLRMADLMALQPNLDIKMHIVAPDDRRDKVFSEIKRPVFSLLERGELAELCTYISYHSVEEMGKLEHLSHLSDSVLDEYEQAPDEAI
jgi:hypothetical protein